MAVTFEPAAATALAESDSLNGWLHFTPSQPQGGNLPKDKG